VLAASRGIGVPTKEAERAKACLLPPRSQRGIKCRGIGHRVSAQARGGFPPLQKANEHKVLGTLPGKKELSFGETGRCWRPLQDQAQVRGVFFRAGFRKMGCRSVAAKNEYPKTEAIRELFIIAKGKNLLRFLGSYIRTFAKLQ